MFTVCSLRLHKQSPSVIRNLHDLKMPRVVTMAKHSALAYPGPWNLQDPQALP